MSSASMSDVSALATYPVLLQGKQHAFCRMSCCLEARDCFFVSLNEDVALGFILGTMN